MFFYKLFTTDELISYITTEANNYAGEYINKEKKNGQYKDFFTVAAIPNIQVRSTWL